MAHGQPGIVRGTFEFDDPYIGDLGNQYVLQYTVAAIPAATADLKRGTLMKLDTGKLVPLAGGAIVATDKIVVLFETIDMAAIVAGDVVSFAHERGDFRRSMLTGYVASQEPALNDRNIYTMDAR